MALGWPHALLALVAIQRMAELALARHNTHVLLTLGAREAGAGHYPLFVILHAAWLAAIAILVAPDPAANLAWLAVFALCQIGRAWVIGTLGPYWTTRIIVMPGTAPVASGPYRFFRHPNYVVVAVEMVALPLAFGLAAVAVVFGALNLALLIWRIRAENAARRDLSGQFA